MSQPLFFEYLQKITLDRLLLTLFTKPLHSVNRIFTLEIYHTIRQEMT